MPGSTKTKTVERTTKNGSAPGVPAAGQAVPTKRAGTGDDEDLRKKLYRAELLLLVAQSCAGFETLSEVLEQVLSIVTRETKAERGTLFLNDAETGELYSRVVQGGPGREIRVLNDSGIAGLVFQTGKGGTIHDTYADPRFNRTIDAQTGFTTKSIACAPVRTATGEMRPDVAT